MATALEVVSLLEKTSVTKEALEVSFLTCRPDLVLSLRLDLVLILSLSPADH